MTTIDTNGFASGTSPDRLSPPTWDELGQVATIQRLSFRKDLAYKRWMLVVFRWLPGVTFLVVREGNEVIGNIIYDSVRGKTRIMNIAVHPDHRQRGVGRKLMTHAMNLHPEQSVVLMVQEENRAARTLYEHLGFTRSGYHASYYGRGNAGIEMNFSRN